ncbi:MAG TPA: glycoside hydrolase family 3 C-terminal domain-containing protein [Candidatus Limnocylindrales bacterium]|nr:glycoside hydrolase family 3 C-terminal domain-containing protein [Candidatus Limnocylindrales bacterium]
MNRLAGRVDDWRSDPETERRVEALLGEMSLDEKVDLVTGDLDFSYAFYNAPIERVGIPALTMADGPAGARVNDRSVNDGRSTRLPAPISLAATWDPELARRYGDVLGAEAFATGHNVQLAPAVDIARAPRGGRTFEAFGEDPLLQSRMVVPEIEGIQAHPVEATIKHFIVNNQEHRRFTIDVQVDERTLREIYLPPFEAAVVDGAVGAAMASFNRVNGTYASEHRELLTVLLRGDLGFRGWVMSDYEATWSTAASAAAGLDQEQPAARFWGERLAAAVATGELPAETIDDMVRHILRPMIGLGLLDHPVEIGPLPVGAHASTSREIAEQGVVLLKNADGFLPLDPVPGSIAVIGPEADNGSVAGAGSGWNLATREVSPLDGIGRRAGAGSRVAYAPGVDPLSAALLLPGPPAIPSGFLAPPRDNSGQHGLLAEYWSNPSFDGEPILTRVEPQAAINLGFFNIPHFNAISPKLPQTPMELGGRISVRWTGSLTASVTGEHELALTSLGSATLFVDGEPMIEVASAGGRPADAAQPAFPPPPPLVPDVGPVVATARVHLVADEPRAIRVDYAADSTEQNEQIGAQLRFGWRPADGTMPPLVREAAALAAACEVAIVVAPTYESEMMDRPDIHLPAEQELLIREVTAANPRTAVVLMSGGPVDVSGWEARVPAILEAWYAGQEQGDAIARVLFGDVNPSGKLPITFPMDEDHTPIAAPEQYPGVGGAVRYSEGILVGYRGYDELGIEPRFPFGHGLSYTSFALERLELRPMELRPGGSSAGRDTDAVEVSFDVVNTGSTRGTEVAQVYVGRLPVDAPTPPRQLAAFARVTLDPGERVRATVGVSRRSLSWWDAQDSRWSTASGEVEIEVGASSRDIRLRGRVTIPG